MFDRNFHFVSQTEGENYARFALTRLCLAGGVPVAASKLGSGAFRRRHSKRANKTTPTRHLSVLPEAFNIDFTWGLPLSFPMFLEAQVRRATETSSRRRAGVFNEGRAASAIASRSEAVTRFVTELEEELARQAQFETRSLTWRRATRGTASKNEWSMTLCWCEHGVWASAAAALACMSSLNDSIFFSFLFFFFELCQKLSYRKGKPSQRERQEFEKTKNNDGEFEDW